MENMDLQQPTMTKKKDIPWKVYAALTLATWGDNMWGFAGGLFMMELQPDNLRLTATYGLVLAAAVICLGAAIGRWIDDTKRLTAARICLVVQNVSVSVCAFVLSLYLSFDREYSGLYFNYGTIVAVIAFSTLARLATTGTNIIMQKDWIVVIADGNNDMLAEMNAVLRTIGLTTYMLAPVLVGQLFTFIGYVPTGIFVAVWNLVSVAFEYTLLELIYRSYPALREKKATEEKESSDEPAVEEVEHLMESKKTSEEKEKPKVEPAAISVDVTWHRGIFEGWRLYFAHPIRNAGLGLASLYMTVLGFDNITYGYVLTQGIPESVLGILVAISAVLGVLGSTAYPFLRRHVGLERTGLLGMFFLVFTSSLAVLSILLPGSPFMLLDDVTTQPNDTMANVTTEEGNVTEEGNIFVKYLVKFQSVGVLLVGITLARFGLWITDLTVTQIMQERVEEANRGVINGVQDSLNNLLDLVKCILVIMLPYTWQFGFLIILSFLAISSGWLVYAGYSKKARGHLFHFDRMVPCHPFTCHDLPGEEEEQGGLELKRIGGGLEEAA